MTPDRRLTCELDRDLDRVIEREPTDGLDFSGVITGLCLCVKLAKLSRLLLEDVGLAAELNEP